MVKLKSYATAADTLHMDVSECMQREVLRRLSTARHVMFRNYYNNWYKLTISQSLGPSDLSLFPPPWATAVESPTSRYLLPDVFSEPNNQISVHYLSHTVYSCGGRGCENTVMVLSFTFGFRRLHVSRRCYLSDIRASRWPRKNSLQISTKAFINFEFASHSRDGGTILLACRWIAEK